MDAKWWLPCFVGLSAGLSVTGSGGASSLMLADDGSLLPLVVSNLLGLPFFFSASCLLLLSS